MASEDPGSVKSPSATAELTRLRLGIRKFFSVPFACAQSPGALDVPVSVLLTEDGRAVAWFGARHPCIVHPSLAELCAMHGVEARPPLSA